VSNNQQTPLVIKLDTLPMAHLLEAYDLLPDILFWIKDTNSKVIYANQCFLDHVGVASLEQAIGLTDLDFAPKHLAKQFMMDDQRVLKGESVTDRLEMNMPDSGEICWFTTSKRPLRDDGGQIIGTYGMSRHMEKTAIVLNVMSALKTPVSYIRHNYMQKISLTKLADISYLSISALERRFKKFLDKTPQQYITQVRLENARRMLVETTLPISVIAGETGFGDPSYFSHKFYQQYAELPSEFRAKHQ
jgi:PAS domain S-box-containing protein